MNSIATAKTTTNPNKINMKKALLIPDSPAGLPAGSDFKSALAAMLALPDTATEADILSAVSAITKKSEAAAAITAEEQEITDLVRQSVGALTRAGAKEVLAHRKQHARKAQ